MTNTHYVLIFMVLFLVAYDVWAGLCLPAGQTISEVVQRMAGEYPVIPYAAGVICGHWFWR